MGIYLIFSGLTLGGILLAVFGGRYAERTSKPRTFRSGAIIAGVGLTLLWVLPLGALALKAREWSFFLFVGALFVAASAIGAGLQAMARAATGQAESAVDHALDSIIQQNDLP